MNIIFPLTTTPAPPNSPRVLRTEKGPNRTHAHLYLGSTTEDLKVEAREIVPLDVTHSTIVLHDGTAITLEHEPCDVTRNSPKVRCSTSIPDLGTREAGGGGMNSARQDASMAAGAFRTVLMDTAEFNPLAAEMCLSLGIAYHALGVHGVARSQVVTTRGESPQRTIFCGPMPVRSGTSTQAKEKLLSVLNDESAPASILINSCKDLTVTEAALEWAAERDIPSFLSLSPAPMTTSGMTRPALLHGNVDEFVSWAAALGLDIHADESTLRPDAFAIALSKVRDAIGRAAPNISVTAGRAGSFLAPRGTRAIFQIVIPRRSGEVAQQARVNRHRLVGAGDRFMADLAHGFMEELSRGRAVPAALVKAAQGASSSALGVLAPRLRLQPKDFEVRQFPIATMRSVTIAFASQAIFHSAGGEIARTTTGNPAGLRAAA